MTERVALSPVHVIKKNVSQVGNIPVHHTWNITDSLNIAKKSPKTNTTAVKTFKNKTLQTVARITWVNLISQSQNQKPQTREPNINTGLLDLAYKTDYLLAILSFV